TGSRREWTKYGDPATKSCKMGGVSRYFFLRIGTEWQENGWSRQSIVAYSGGVPSQNAKGEVRAQMTVTEERTPARRSSPCVCGTKAARTGRTGADRSAGRADGINVQPSERRPSG